VKLGNTPESKSYEDHSLGPYAYTGQGGNLLDSLLQQSMKFQQSPPQGYNNWLKDTLNRLTPQDWYVLQHNHGVTPEDLGRLKQYVHGNYQLDPSAYPYNDKVQPQ
jgi:hypothetical protein